MNNQYPEQTHETEAKHLEQKCMKIHELLSKVIMNEQGVVTSWLDFQHVVGLD